MYRLHSVLRFAPLDRFAALLPLRHKSPACARPNSPVNARVEKQAQFNRPFIKR